MKLSTKYGDRIIEFDVGYRNRKTLAIQIEPPEKILVLSPVGLSEDILKEKVNSKGKWIINKLFDFKDMGYIPFNREFVNGESFMYLGRNYLLQIILDKDILYPKVKIVDKNLTIITPNKEQPILKKAIEKWYRRESKKVILKRIEFYKPKFKVVPSQIKIKEQKKRWGSCTSKGILLFNWRTVMAPSPVIDYIIVHEMSHLTIRNHSSIFWKSVENILPDYKERKKWLKDYGVRMDL
jgi:predicted metal-dependent hydrolase